MYKAVFHLVDFEAAIKASVKPKPVQIYKGSYYDIEFRVEKETGTLWWKARDTATLMKDDSVFVTVRDCEKIDRYKVFKEYVYMSVSMKGRGNQTRRHEFTVYHRKSGTLVFRDPVDLFLNSAYVEHLYLIPVMPCVALIVFKGHASLHFCLLSGKKCSKLIALDRKKIQHPGTPKSGIFRTYHSKVGHNVRFFMYWRLD